MWECCLCLRQRARESVVCVWYREKRVLSVCETERRECCLCVRQREGSVVCVWDREKRVLSVCDTERRECCLCVIQREGSVVCVWYREKRRVLFVCDTERRECCLCVIQTEDERPCHVLLSDWSGSSAVSDGSDGSDGWTLQIGFSLCRWPGIYVLWFIFCMSTMQGSFSFLFPPASLQMVRIIGFDQKVRNCMFFCATF